MSFLVYVPYHKGHEYKHIHLETVRRKFWIYNKQDWKNIYSFKNYIRNQLGKGVAVNNTRHNCSWSGAADEVSANTTWYNCSWSAADQVSANTTWYNSS
jgi:hypothetical protein